MKRLQVLAGHITAGMSGRGEDCTPSGELRQDCVQAETGMGLVTLKRTRTVFEPSFPVALDQSAPYSFRESAEGLPHRLTCVAAKTLQPVCMWFSMVWKERSSVERPC